MERLSNEKLTRDQLASLANKLSSTQPALLEHLRPLEQRLGLVFTLLKASVWVRARIGAGLMMQATFVEREAREAEQEQPGEEDLSMASNISR